MDRLSGPVDVCVAVPRLALDRPFTYHLPEDADAGTGSLVTVRFHGRSIRAWVLGPAGEDRPSRLLPVTRVRSRVRFFDERMLRLLRWVSERYVVPLATAIERSHPPRVAAEERDSVPEDEPGNAERADRAGGAGDGGVGGAHDADARGRRRALPCEPGATTWLRPIPGQEGEACVRAVEATLAAGRTALVLVPEADPLPHTAAAVLARFGDRAVAFVGGDARERYRTWLRVGDGRYDVVVGTRPAVFAPLRRLGLVWVSREVHPGHREDRSPSYHVRDVASARARLEGAACVLAALSPSVETAAAVAAGTVAVRRPPRAVERAAAPLVETVPPEAEDRSSRLARLLRTARSAALVVSRAGYGVARVCRSCREPAACAACRGPIVVEGGAPACRVCGDAGRCAACGGRAFGVERGGAERVAEWASGVAPVRVRLAPDGGEAGPQEGAVVVGTAASVKDVGPLRVDLVAILDPDRALRRPGLRAGERALATWMEAAAWAGPREAGGRVLAQTRRPDHPALQALVRWEPERYLRAEAAAREAAGFPPGHPVFRVEGPAGADMQRALGEDEPGTLLVSSAGDRTVCLVAVRPEALPSFASRVRALAADGVVARVEAEPQL